MVERIAIIYIESEVQTMRTEKKELNIQIGKRLQTVRENSRYTQEACGGACMIHTSKQLKDKVRNISKGNNEVAKALIRIS